MAKLKLKPGNISRIKFAGMTYEGELISIEIKEYGTVKRTVYKFKTSDGTIYPISDTSNILTTNNSSNETRNSKGD